MNCNTFPVKSLSKTVIIPEALTAPFDCSGRHCVLEIGFGNGEYTIHQAKESPDTLFVGIEMSQGCVLRALVRAVGLDNLRMMCGDARFIVRECFCDNSFDRVQMNFPCPWPKGRHAKYRVVTSLDFVNTLAAVLKPNGYFELVTDEEQYARDAMDALCACDKLSLMSFERNPERSVTTRYERKWLEMGKDIWRVRVQKVKNSTVPRVVAWGEDMHILKAGHPKTDEIGTLLNHQGGEGDLHWVFRRYYTAPDDVYMFETVSIDAGFEQKYFLKAVKRDFPGDEVCNRTLIKIVGPVFLTPSVRGAMEDLASMLCG